MATVTEPANNTALLETDAFKLDTTAISPSTNAIPVNSTDDPLCQCPEPRNLKEIHTEECPTGLKMGEVVPPIHGMKAAKSVGSSTKARGTWKRVKGGIRIAIGKVFNNNSIKMKGKEDKKMGIDQLNSASGSRYNEYISQ
ncbi:hypothetical protein CONCODRAFT_77674 [Conidiobolus coronatus NRRL 28638]|uniref:Uncharacterized protein n=1 Tax=Conidiobolus coronatus (strain ATCC 28846 / CBS 209.66 / NRRL 28638) TaxID=796925 RepID=A0A137PCQ0_CONC2|nr:hypothetical protein CONCODRAFT_77674 [Conidiobolus coronatus NRRL 28638]|eukprot:KXN72742.1 hypothetical protein CONCODRAFT_77674 [Conidiobolus coronatus NRRL 28638]